MSSLLETAPALWDPATGRIYTFMIPGPDPAGPLVSAWGRETLPELIALADAADRQRLCKGPQPIDAERFDELLNMLPPQRWVRGEAAESFRISEAVTGDLYTFCVRIGDRHFSITERGGATHDELVRLCSAA